MRTFIRHFHFRLRSLSLATLLLAACPLAASADPPAAPTGLVATTPVDAAIRLDWDPQQASFHIYRKRSTTGFSQIATTTANTYLDSGLTWGEFTYVVTADNGEESPYSNEASASPTNAPPSRPNNLQALVQGDTVQFTWELDGPAPPTGLTYNVWWKWASGGDYVKANAAPLVDMSLVRARARDVQSYKVSSLDSEGRESMSLEAVTVDGRRLPQEPRRNPAYLGAAGSVTAHAGELVWGFP